MADARWLGAESQTDSFMISRMAAKQLGVSLRTVQLWVEKCTLRAWKTVGGHRRIAKSWVDELLREQRAAIKAPAKDGDFSVVVVEVEPMQRRIIEMQFEEWALPVRLVTAKSGGGLPADIPALHKKPVAYDELRLLVEDRLREAGR